MKGRYRYLFRKLLILPLSLFTVATLTFFLIRAVPGSPFIDEKGMPEEVVLSLKKYYKLDLPLKTQYISYLKALTKGDLGKSLKYEGRSVNSIIKEHLPISMRIGIQAFILASLGGIFLGALSVIWAGKWQDKFLLFSTAIGISIPSFILATLLQYIFAVKLCWLPSARATSFLHTILPSISLAFVPLAAITKLTRSSMLEVYKQDYILTALAKGLTRYQIFKYHVLKNSLIPIITYLGPLSISILTGSFVVETIFAIPGLGKWLVDSIAHRDYSVIMGITLFYSFFLMLAVLVVDAISLFLNPRIAYE